MSPEKTERFWQAAAQRLAWRINLGWWLERWMSWVMAGALLGAVAILFFRWMPLIELRWVWISIGAAIFSGAIAAWFMVRRHFENVATARVRLEDALGLKTRLSAAAAGIGEWPQPMEGLTHPVLWRWQKPLGVFCFGLIMLMLATKVPMAQKEIAKQRVIEKPSDVKQVEQWIENMRKEEAVLEKSLDEVEKKIAEMMQRPSENWYEHGSLEAAGNLKDQTMENLRELSENLADATRAAAALQAAGDALPQEAKDAIANELASALQGLRNGGIKPNEQLLKQLQKMADANGMGNLSREQLQKLAEQMQQNAQALQEALKNSPELKLTECRSPGKGKGKGEGEGEEPGKGGINRGPGTAPITFKEDETNLGTKKMEAVTSQLDMNRIAPGDVLGVQNGQHEVDKNGYTGPKQGGGIQSAGDGGAAVWQNSLMPAEREALKKYFK